MGCYVLVDEQISMVATAIIDTLHRADVHKGDEIAQQLRIENVRTVNERYNETEPVVPVEFRRIVRKPSIVTRAFEEYLYNTREGEVHDMVERAHYSWLKSLVRSAN